MIIDLNKFISDERPFWTELEGFVERLESDPAFRLDLDQIRRFHYLYQRVSADLARIQTFSAEKNLGRYLEALVGRSYGYIHESRRRTR
ncbi:MAG: stage II sporulation protein M, partial [Desulfosudaceae bacterium]